MYNLYIISITYRDTNDILHDWTALLHFLADIDSLTMIPTVYIACINPGPNLIPAGASGRRMVFSWSGTRPAGMD
jgi:hypothetical protein